VPRTRDGNGTAPSIVAVAVVPIPGSLTFSLRMVGPTTVGEARFGFTHELAQIAVVNCRMGLNYVQL